MQFLDYDKKVQQIMNANKEGGCTIISAANYGHRFFTLNWMTSLEMNQFNKFVVFSYDDELIQFLSEKGYANRTIKIPNFLLEKNVTTDSSDFMTPNFLALVQSRSKLFLKLLELGIAFLFSDVDTVWMSNRVVEYVEFVYKHSYAEILFSEDTVSRRNHYNTGFFYATPTNFTINLYKMLIDEQRKNPGIIDQFTLDAILRKINHDDNRMRGLDQLIIANGHIFFFSKLHLHFNINANYIPTVAQKLQKLKENNLWYIKDAY